MEKPIRHRYLHFGPIISGTVCDSDLVSQLLARGKNTDKSHHEHLAGHIKKENIFDTADKQWFVDNFSKYFIPYFKKLQDINDPTFFYGMPPFNEVWLSSLWINFMRKGEYNPPHDHDGDFSFVLYLKVPAELDKEESDFQGKGTGPGCIQFLYGEQQTNITTGHALHPRDNNLWIFPASLKHTVPPFKSDVERISVSGNWYIVDKFKDKQTLDIAPVNIK